MFEIGKIPPKILEDIVFHTIKNGKVHRKEVVFGPKTGEDCCGIAYEDEICVVSSDPITGASDDIGYLAVQINCNDIFSSGAEPIGILLTVLLPKNSSEDDLQTIMQGAMRGANELGIEILGGHTEVSDAVIKPLVSATVLGKVKKDGFISTGGGRVGQDIVMSKFAGLEGTSILTHEHTEVLRKRGMSEELIAQGKSMKTMLSVGVESKIATAHGVFAMHDVTEGGIFGAVWEVATCSGLGVKLYEEKIPLLEATKLVCQLGGISPFTLISSGVLLMVTDDGNALVEKLKQADIPSALIGKLTEGDCILIKKDGEVPLAEPQGDALYDCKF
ncbi:MAG: AIR synthase family protein [Bacillota bacterium]